MTLLYLRLKPFIISQNTINCFPHKFLIGYQGYLYLLVISSAEKRFVSITSQAVARKLQIEVILTDEPLQILDDVHLHVPLGKIAEVLQRGAELGQVVHGLDRHVVVVRQVVGDVRSELEVSKMFESADFQNVLQMFVADLAATFDENLLKIDRICQNKNNWIDW